MAHVFKAIVQNIESVERETSGYTDKKIYVTPLSVNSPEMSFRSAPLEVYPPSALPTGENGSGVLSFPSPGQLCWVIKEEGETKGQILSYTNHAAIPAGGIFEPENLEQGSVLFKVGGINKALLKLSPDGGIALESSPAFSSLRMYGKTNIVELRTKEFNLSYEGGITKYGYFPTGHPINEEKVTSYQATYAIKKETRMQSDITQADTESYLDGAIALPTYSYVDKAVVRSGQIYNVGMFGEDAKRTHVYQIETRQATNGNNKDTITVMAFGYQSEHYKFNDDKKYAAGTMFEHFMKRTNGAKANTYLMRYGRQEGNSDTESMEGEIFRIQIYEDKLVGGNPLTNAVAKGEGYNYDDSVVSNQHTYIQSFGTISDGSVYRNLITDGDLEYRTTIGADGYEKVFELGSAKIEHTLKQSGDWSLSINDDEVIIKQSGGSLNIIAKGSVNITGAKPGDLSVGHFIEGGVGFCKLPFCVVTGTPHTTGAM